MYNVLIIGGGPIGLACAIELKRKGVTSLILEKGSVADAVRKFPTEMTFFSTSELIELGEVPLISDGIRPTRYEALKYYSRVASSEKLDIRRFTEVSAVEAAGGTFNVRSAAGEIFSAHKVIFATGYFDHPNLLNVPGESLPHVSHYYDEGLKYSKMNVTVIGGQNSACDTALDLYRAGANVTLVHRQEKLGQSVKYWIRPDIENRIKNGEIRAEFSAKVTHIAAKTIRIRGLADGHEKEIPADFIFPMIGYHPDIKLLETAGVDVEPQSLIPTFDAETFQTNVAGLYVAGSTTAGKRTSNIFIENGRVHAAKIATHIAAGDRL